MITYQYSKYKFLRFDNESLIRKISLKFVLIYFDYKFLGELNLRYPIRVV